MNTKFFLKTKTVFNPYIVVEGGIYRISREVYGQFIDKTNNSNSITPMSDKTNDGALNVGFGIEYPINEIINFDLNARYHYLLDKKTYNFGDIGYGSSYSTISFFSINAGLVIFFE